MGRDQAKSRNRRRFARSLPDRSYRTLFIIASEGNCTEPAYFKHFRSDKVTIHIVPSKHKSDPLRVLGNAVDFVKKKGIKETDLVWIVIDRDEWTEQSIEDAWKGCQSRSNFHLAVSNPCFEFWLLLHFENGKGVSTRNKSRDCLRKHLPKYAKNRLEMRQLATKIEEAVARAEAKDNPPCEKWPDRPGSTVYRLIQAIQKAEE